MNTFRDILRKKETIWETLGVGGKIVKLILKKQDMTTWKGFNWHRIGASADSCEHGNELQLSIKDREFLNQPCDY
jgi:hypothetical protein